MTTHQLPAWLLGVIRGLGFAVITAVLSYFGSAEHLSFLNPGTAALVATVVLAIENQIASKGPALFGAVKRNS